MDTPNVIELLYREGGQALVDKTFGTQAEQREYMSTIFANLMTDYHSLMIDVCIKFWIMAVVVTIVGSIAVKLS